MLVKGQKRKLPPEDEDVSDGRSLIWERQRQFVLSVSMNKYQRGQELAEPSLWRSVLIANTLRQISLEASWAPCAGEEPPPCSSSSEHQENLVSAAKRQFWFPAANNWALDVPHCSTSRHDGASDQATQEEEEDDWASMSIDPDFSLSAAISSILTVLDSSVDAGPQAASRTTLRSIENLPVPPEGGMSPGKQGGRCTGRLLEQQEEGRTRESSMETLRSSYLSDFTMEDLFQDIDTSLLEGEVGFLGLRGSAADDLLRFVPQCPTPSSSRSLSHNMKCLPSFSSFSPPSLSSPPASLTPGLTHVREGLELEHLIEILVES